MPFFNSFFTFLKASIHIYIYIYISIPSFLDEILCPTTHYCLKYIPPTRTSRKDVLIVNAGNGQPDMGPEWARHLPCNPSWSVLALVKSWMVSHQCHQAVIPICACFSNLGHIAKNIHRQANRHGAERR